MPTTRSTPAAKLPICPDLLLDRDGPVLRLTLNRPDVRNAMTGEMVRQLTEVVAWAEDHPEVGTLVISGAGGTFCAGGDIKGFMASFRAARPEAGQPDPIQADNRRFGHFLTRIEALPQTVVVAVEGAAFGGGLGLACIGDVVIATRDARFALSETGLGIPPAQIAPFVAARIGVSQARRLALTGMRFDGAEAGRIGLVHEVVEDGAALEARVAKLVADIRRCAPGANATTKRLLMAQRTTALPDLLDLSSAEFARCLRGAEGQEGVAAFLEKRQPAWAAGS
ncbi:enoyl-CoA hydratase/isomerase family protein [Tistrella mobilis]|uniref:Enoyl-CoA hydratase/isomerase family protein n=1 Tax=Tistrella mobilis (strain KA081020-065) TaxID=1110502 RepID=I3TUD7_TISMK|nr:enoyl-CoA hydratase-related protein [Tistrella mobilis]AFK56375.1 enoyl-CoA hydratase/isomerase family protein [Tistrella mobilis KA081020-065]